MKPTAVPTFVQNSRIHPTIFQIRGHELAISIIRPDEGFSEHLVDLRTVSPDYQPRAVRIHALLVIPGVMAVLSAIVVWGLMQLPAVVPREPLMHFVFFPAMVFAVSFALAVQGSRRVEYYVFNNHWKKPSFEIICERQQRAECAAFISTLVARIELAQADLPEAERARLLEQVETENLALASPAPGGQRWKVAIIFGVLAASVTVLPDVGLDVDPTVFILVFPLCMGGVASSYYSFQTREPNRWWSLVGAVLSLLPPFSS